MAGKAGTVYIKADRNVEVAKTSVMICAEDRVYRPGNACQDPEHSSADLSSSG